MNTKLFRLLLLCSALTISAHGDVYAPTTSVGQFLKLFEAAYTAGDSEWFHSAVDREGIIDEAKISYFSYLGSEDRSAILGATDNDRIISNLRVIAAPSDYELSSPINNVEPTINVDFLIKYTRSIGGGKIGVTIPVGYRDEKIYLVGIKRK